jgi:hypothetical protein
MKKKRKKTKQISWAHGMILGNIGQFLFIRVGVNSKFGGKSGGLPGGSVEYPPNLGFVALKFKNTPPLLYTCEMLNIIDLPENLPPRRL